MGQTAPAVACGAFKKQVDVNKQKSMAQKLIHNGSCS